ncbi:MAG: 2Fe-2S iron-sulfur cluster-binding protein, partial [Paracoccus sp. (in: a-proteobacteria)]
MSRYRIPGMGRVDPAATVSFTFDGRTYQGLRGDTVASALLANGVHLMGRSFKYHRPRGVVTAGSEEPNALIGTSRGKGRFEPNTRATVQELRAGLTTES